MDELDALRQEVRDLSAWRWAEVRRLEDAIRQTHAMVDAQLIRLNRRIQKIEPTPLPEPTPITPAPAPRKRERKPLSKQAAVEKAREALRLANQALDD